MDKLLSIVMAILIVNPICCCQGIEILWADLHSPDANISSCGCQKDAPADSEGENGPCSTCPARAHKTLTPADLPTLAAPEADATEPSEFWQTAAAPILGSPQRQGHLLDLRDAVCWRLWQAHCVYRL